MATINEWFENKDYAEGLAFLAMNSKNRTLVNALSRKQMPEKLEHELKKLLPMHHVQTVKYVETVKHVESHSDQVIDQMNATPMNERLKIVRNDRTIAFDELPREMQARWTQNRDAYKEIRSLHEKLKLMDKADAKDRAPLCGRIAQLDDKIRENWESIDRWDPSAKSEEKELEKIDHKRLQSNRKFISTNLRKLPAQKDEVKVAKVVSELQIRYNEIIKSGEAVSADTINELSKTGVKI